MTALWVTLISAVVFMYSWDVFRVMGWVDQGETWVAVVGVLHAALMVVSYITFFGSLIVYIFGRIWT